MMQTPNSTFSSPLATPTSSRSTEAKVQVSSPSSSVSRQWRPLAQRNLKNRWLKLVSHKQKWVSASSTGRYHATALVNAHLSERYVPLMDLGVLSDMSNIRQRACLKLAQQQEHQRRNLLCSYKDMVGVVSDMINGSSSLRYFMKGSAGSSLVQVSNPSDNSDLGDGGGIPVFSFWSILHHENLASEFVQMFASELILKRFLVLELLSISCEKQPTAKLSWSNELYPGEFEDLRSSGLYCEETCRPCPPRIIGHESDSVVTAQLKVQPECEVLQVYLTTWMVEANIDTHRVEEIFSIIGEEMHTNLH